MDELLRKKLIPGTQVHVTQQIPHRNRTWTNDIRGIIISYEQKQTGSWYAHAKDDKLWLDRLTLRTLDGELSSLILDEYSCVEIEAPVAAPATLPSNS
jgi:hypothetical protein